MNIYNDAKIYKIYSLIDDSICYVGSTCNKKLCQRMAGHKSQYKRWKSNKCGKNTVYDIFDQFGLENCIIELIENYPCNNKDELNKKEGGYIRQLNCINKRIEGRTQKEYYESNKDRLLEQKKEYYESNKDRLLEHQKEYYESNKDRLLENAKEYYECNKDRIKEYYECNKDRIKEYYEFNKDKILENAKEYYECNKDKILEYQKQYRNKTLEEMKLKIRDDLGIIKN